jgi:plasmid maintenance system antidote protein VapI
MARKKSTVSETLRAAIDADERSRYRICQLAEIDQAAMSRFMNGTAGLKTDSVDRLAEVLGLELTPKGSGTTKKGK